MWDEISAYSDLVMAVVAVLTLLGTFVAFLFFRYKGKNDDKPASIKKSNIQIGKNNINVGDGSKVQINSKD